MNQCVFNFFVVVGQGRRNVERLCRFRPELIGKEHKVKGDKLNTYRTVRGGQLCALGYEAWLRFYSPLCERGAA